MTDPTKKGFNPGGVKDIYDSRDYSYREVAHGSKPFDWKKGFDIEETLSKLLKIKDFKIPTKDQDGSSSCGGQAWSYYNAVLEALYTKTFEERSAKYIYGQTWVPGGGSRGRDNAEIMRKQGVCLESVLTSYDNGKPPSEAFITRSNDITIEARQNAKTSRSSIYAQIGIADPEKGYVVIEIDDIAKAIRDFGGVVLGIDGSNNGTWKSNMPKPPKTDDKGPWRHWIYAGKAKLIKGKKYIGVLNSWGDDTGDDGWQWISEDYIKTYIKVYNEQAVWSGWTHIFATDTPPNDFKYTFTKDLKEGSKGKEVEALQTALKLISLFPEDVPITGYFGSITTQAVMEFQFKYKEDILIPVGLTNPTGYVGKSTRAKLNQLFG